MLDWQLHPQSSIGILLGLLALMGLHGETLALRCYVCDSESDPACAATPDLSSVQDCSRWCQDRAGFIPERKIQVGERGPTQYHKGVPCPVEFNTCRKINQQMKNDIYTKGAFAEQVIRTCGFLEKVQNVTTNEPEMNYRSTETSRSMVYNCFSDQCNSGSLSVLSVNILILVSFFCLTKPI